MKYSRRNFIRQNSMLAFGAALTSSASAEILGTLGPAAQPVQSKSALFFDAFALIGPRRYKHAAERWQLTELLQEMEHCSIAGAMVASTPSVYYDPMHSNLELSDNLKPYPQITGQKLLKVKIYSHYRDLRQQGKKKTSLAS